MTKAELIEAIRDLDGDLSKNTVNNVLNHLATAVCQTLADGGEVTLPGLMKLSVSDRAERQGRNPRTGETITIAACKVPKMKALKAFKDGIY